MRAILMLGCLFVGACEGGPTLDRNGKPITVGRFRLRTYPKGARVWIDGKLAAVSTPATLILEEGTYPFRIQLEGAEAVERTVRVKAGTSRELSLRIPRPPDATLTVLSDVEGADVRINGYRRGQTPLMDAVTRPGAIDITVTAPNGHAKSVKTTLEIAETKNVEVLFSPVTSETSTLADRDELQMSQQGRLTLGLQPDGFVSDARGTPLGPTPLVERRMSAGTHRLLLRSRDRALERRVTVEIHPNRTAVYRFSLHETEHRRRSP